MLLGLIADGPELNGPVAIVTDDIVVGPFETARAARKHQFRFPALAHGQLVPAVTP